MSTKPRGVLLAGNWKMNHGPKATQAFFEELAGAGALPSSVRYLIFPSFTSLAAASDHAAKARTMLDASIAIGAQNASWERSGAFTGEVSGPMLTELGLQNVLIGHSERRQFFGETPASAGKRTLSLLEQGFRVMLCIGETRAERDSGKMLAVLTEQVAGGLPAGVEKFLNGTVVVAYEPVWAIGTGVNATPEQAEEAHQAVRKLIWDRFGMQSAGTTPVLYGGSVKPDNAATLIAKPNIDGFLVGGASLKAADFRALAQACGKLA